MYYTYLSHDVLSKLVTAMDDWAVTDSAFGSGTAMFRTYLRTNLEHGADPVDGEHYVVLENDDDIDTVIYFLDDMDLRSFEFHEVC